MSKRPFLSLNQFFTMAIKNHGYMTGVTRDKSRVKATAEVFTPDGLVQEVLQRLQTIDKTAFEKEKTFLDPSCGDGQFLTHVLYCKVQYALGDESRHDENCFHLFKECLGTIYGVDLMPDNVRKCHDRLTCGIKALRPIVENNIRCENALTYDFSFE